MAGLRESAVGRAFVVGMVLATAWATWNLTLRPYPSNYCDGPVAVLSWSPEPVESRPTPRRSVAPRLDDNGDGMVSDFERRFYEAGQNVPQASGNFTPTSAGELRNDRCRDALTEVGFWMRGLWPLFVLVGGAVVVRYVTTGNVRRPASEDPENEAIVR